MVARKNKMFELMAATGRMVEMTFTWWSVFKFGCTNEWMFDLTVLLFVKKETWLLDAYF
jgi:hypothetical protein